MTVLSLDGRGPTFMLSRVQRLGIWLAVIGAAIGLAVVAVLLWIIVAIFGD